jgi:hypothetical protein
MGRDLGQNTWEIMNGTMPDVFGGELLGKSLEIFGHVSTSYDVISETNSKATRAERLTDLTILVAQWELQGTRNDPGSTGNSQFNIQKDDFESAEQASEVFNNMYNMIDAAYKNFDLTKNDDFNLVQGIILNGIMSNNVKLKDIAKDALKLDQSQPASYNAEEEGKCN